MQIIDILWTSVILSTIASFLAGLIYYYYKFVKNPSLLDTLVPKKQEQKHEQTISASPRQETLTSSLGDSQAVQTLLRLEVEREKKRVEEEEKTKVQETPIKLHEDEKLDVV